MTENTKTSSITARHGFLAKILRTCRSLRLAVIMMALIAIACIIGTLIKQEPFSGPEAFSQAIARYGRVLGALVILFGLNQLYSTWWFLGLLGLFALSSTVCAFSKFRFRVRMLGSLIAHASVLFIVAGVILRAALGVGGTLTLAEGETADAFQTNKETMPLGFRIRLDSFNLRYYDSEEQHDFLAVYLDPEAKPGIIPVEVDKVVQLQRDGIAIKVLRHLPHFMMDLEGKRIYSASDEPINPAVEILVTGAAGKPQKKWFFAKPSNMHGYSYNWPEGLRIIYVRTQPPIKAYESQVTVLDENDKVLQKSNILVNEPLKVGRYTLCQLSYDPRTEASSTLGVSYDPGWLFVLIGFVLLPFGVAFTFYIEPLLRRKGDKDA